MLQLVIWNICK